jgi:uncharacterized membrane protein YeaQ/YmgE (transglycosylase-associated protein family)
MAKGSKKAKAKSKARQERRFLPLPAGSGTLVNVLGGLSAASLGAGVFGQYGHDWLDNPAPPYGFAPALIGAGAVLFAAAVWLGTSGEASLRVGSGGIGIEKAKDVVRIPWHRVERVTWDPDRTTLSVSGKDEAGRIHNLALSPKVYPGAIGWIVKEARGRIPLLVDVPDEARGLPVAQMNEGEVLTMDPIQVVGQRCAESNRIIAYEPDARVCVRCERVYYRLSVPEACACGASLTSLRDATTPAEDKPDAQAEATEPANADARATAKETAETGDETETAKT